MIETLTLAFVNIFLQVNSMNLYIASFKGVKQTIEADSLYAAKLKALAIFKPSKKNEHLVWVVLVQLANGETVVHSTASL